MNIRRFGPEMGEPFIFCIPFNFFQYNIYKVSQILCTINILLLLLRQGWAGQGRCIYKSSLEAQIDFTP